ncbi:MAG: ChaN family lipoprotein [Sandaracinaceae bacterium]
MRSLPCLLALALLACGPAPTPASPRAPTGPVVIDGRSGALVPWAEVLTDLRAARAVYIGERHDRAGDHDAQRALVEALAEGEGRLAVGLEMVQRPYQPALDAYVAGRIGAAAMLEGVEWEARWGFDAELYLPILRVARARRLPVVALNARRELTRAVGTAGIEGLPEELAADLPELRLDDPAHRAMVEDALAGHPGLTDDHLERMYQAQVVWDETMADSAARALAEPEGPARIVVLAGRFHVLGGLGIPGRAARRGVEPYRIVLPVDAEEVGASVSADAPAADYLWVVDAGDDGAALIAWR